MDKEYSGLFKRGEDKNEIAKTLTELKNVFSRPPSRRVLVQDFLVDHPTCSTIHYLEIQDLPVEQQDLVERQVGFLLI